VPSKSQETTSLEQLAAALRSAWGPDTSTEDAWSASLPERGQCAVTALIVQDAFGGALLRAKVAGESHYWNRLPSGEEVDLTRGQFRSFTPGPTEVRGRDYVLSFSDTLKRYLVLRERVRVPLGDSFLGHRECS